MQEIESNTLRILQIPVVSLLVFVSFVLLDSVLDNAGELLLPLLSVMSCGMQLDTFVVFIKIDGFVDVNEDSLMIVLETSCTLYSITKDKKYK
ncbi:MAG: hypothetical protein L0H55_06380 [Candidatus Nitrosocosmicus sp.]|nr:hypothetical protein [Candidatus Nitrosocosmicus sp.]